MKNVTINIPDMQRTHCQVRVRDAVNSIPGAQLRHQEAGMISVDLDTDHLEAEVIKAIKKAGYTVAPANNTNTSLT